MLTIIVQSLALDLSATPYQSDHQGNADMQNSDITLCIEAQSSTTFALSSSLRGARGSSVLSAPGRSATKASSVALAPPVIATTSAKGHECNAHRRPCSHCRGTTHSLTHSLTHSITHRNWPASVCSVVTKNPDAIAYSFQQWHIHFSNDIFISAMAHSFQR